MQVVFFFIIIIIFCVFFFFFLFLPLSVRFSISQASLFLLLASRWLEVTQTEVVWAAERGPPASEGSPGGAFAPPPTPRALLLGTVGTGRGSGSCSAGCGGLGVGGRGARKLERCLSPVEGGELPSSSPAPGCCNLPAPCSSWCYGFILAKPALGLGVSEMAGLLFARASDESWSPFWGFLPPPPLTGARRRQAAAVLLANLSPWKEEMPFSALRLHSPAHTGCTGFNSTGTRLDG